MTDINFDEWSSRVALFISLLFRFENQEDKKTPQFLLGSVDFIKLSTFYIAN